MDYLCEGIHGEEFYLYPDNLFLIMFLIVGVTDTRETLCSCYLGCSSIGNGGSGAVFLEVLPPK